MMNRAVAALVVTAFFLNPASSGAADLFPPSAVRLAAGPMLEAQETNARYVLAHDVDRLLAPIRAEAGLEPRGPRYGNWESMNISGHTAGHYLTALAQIYANTGDAEAKRRLDYMVAELAEVQGAHEPGDLLYGYIGGVGNSRQLWEQVRRGELRVQGGWLNGAWAP